MKVDSIPESRGVRIRLCDGVCAFAKRRFYRIWYSRWIDRHVKVRQLVVKLWRPFAEMRVPCDLKSVNLGPRWAAGSRVVVGQVSLDRLQCWERWHTFSRRDLRVIRAEIARKRVLNVMQEKYGYPTDAEIRDHYKRRSLGKVNDADHVAFEDRIKVRP